MSVALRIVGLAGGILLGILALDDLGAVRVPAAFAGTDAAQATVGLGYLPATTLFAGGVLA
jgi:hypothetical protein